MYEKYYKFSGIPFQLTPDSRFFFGSSGHSRAIAHLVYGLAQQEGFIVITGEVGAGKTTLVEQLWSQLDRNTYVLARVVTTQVSGDDLLRLVVANFGVPDDGGADKATLLRRFERMAQDQRAAGRRCLLVVDEVQNLSMAALEELRMLSNITVDGRASVQTILLGQPQFRSHPGEPGPRTAAPTHPGVLSSGAAHRGGDPLVYRTPAEAGSAGPVIRAGKMPRSPICSATPTAYRGGSTRFVRASCCTARSRRATPSPARWWRPRRPS